MVCPVCITTAVVANLPVISASLGGLAAVKACQQSQRARELREQRVQRVQRAKLETLQRKTEKKMIISADDIMKSDIGAQSR